MGKLMDEFDKAHTPWSIEGIGSEALILRVCGYTATVTEWQGDRYKVHVVHRDAGVVRTVESTTLEYCGEEGAREAAYAAIRSDISRREWMTEGPARLAALEAEVARLTEKLTPKETPPNSCPECKSTDVQRLPWILTSEPPQQPWACRVCNHRWNTYC